MTLTTRAGHPAFYRCTEADGIPVVLLHGWSANADLNFGPVFEHLTGRSVIAPDLRSHTDGPRGTFSLQDAASDVADLLDHLGIDRAIIAGYSMGGAVTQILASARPDLVAGTVYIATAARFGTGRTWPLFRAASAAGRIAPKFPPVAAIASALLGPGHDVPPAWTWAASDIARHDWPAVFNAALALERFDGRSLAGKQQAPAASVITTADTTVPPGRQSELADLSQGARFKVRAGHTAPITHARAVSATIVDAIDHIDQVAAYTTAA